MSSILEYLGYFSSQRRLYTCWCAKFYPTGCWNNKECEGQASTIIFSSKAAQDKNWSVKSTPTLFMLCGIVSNAFVVFSCLFQLFWYSRLEKCSFCSARFIQAVVLFGMPNAFIVLSAGSNHSSIQCFSYANLLTGAGLVSVDVKPTWYDLHWRLSSCLTNAVWHFPWGLSKCHYYKQTLLWIG